MRDRSHLGESGYKNLKSITVLFFVCLFLIGLFVQRCLSLLDELKLKNIAAN